MSVCQFLTVREVSGVPLRSREIVANTTATVVADELLVNDYLLPVNVTTGCVRYDIISNVTRVRNSRVGERLTLLMLIRTNDQLAGTRYRSQFRNHSKMGGISSISFVPRLT